MSKKYTLPSCIGTITVANAKNPEEGNVSIVEPAGYQGLRGAYREAMIELVKLQGKRVRS
jgi:hypothetical protein